MLIFRGVHQLKFNSSPLEKHGWKTIYFCFGMVPRFRGELCNLTSHPPKSVLQNSFHCINNVFLLCSSRKPQQPFKGNAGVLEALSEAFVTRQDLTLFRTLIVAWRTAQNCLYKRCFNFQRFEWHTRSVHQLWVYLDIKTPPVFLLIQAQADISGCLDNPVLASPTGPRHQWRSCNRVGWVPRPSRKVEKSWWESLPANNRKP